MSFYKEVTHHTPIFRLRDSAGLAGEEGLLCVRKENPGNRGHTGEETLD